MCSSLESNEIENLYHSIKEMLEVLAEGDGSMVWIKEQQLIEKWNTMINQNSIDEISSEIIEIAPIKKNNTGGASTFCNMGFISIDN